MDRQYPGNFSSSPQQVLRAACVTGGEVYKWEGIDAGAETIKELRIRKRCAVTPDSALICRCNL